MDIPHKKPRLTLVHVVYTVLSCLLTITVGLQVRASNRLYEVIRVVDEIDKRLVIMESTALTIEDGKEVNERVFRINERLALIPSTIPPTWFAAKVTNLDNAFQIHARAQVEADKIVAKNLGNISIAIARIEATLGSNSK